MATSVRDEPVFIVGAPRSGTTLLAAIINGHSNLACGPETHLFNKISQKELEKAVKDRRWPNRALKLLMRLELSGQSVVELFSLTRDDIYDYLNLGKPSTRTMLESVTYQYAIKKGKKRWAEKTPNHLLHLNQIRESFPNAPVVRIVRDPRDTVLSMCKLPWSSQSPIANSLLWMSWFNESKHFFDSDTNSVTVRYENLIRNPVTELKRVCALIGEVFEPEMLNTEVSAKDVTSPKETWKENVGDPLAKDRIYAWKSSLDPEYRKALSFSLLPGIEQLGYEVDEEPKRSIGIFFYSYSSIERSEAVFLETAQNDIALFQEPNFATAESLLMLPAAGMGLPKYLEANLSIIRTLLLRWANKKQTFYYPDTKFGILADIFRFLFCRSFKTRDLQDYRQ